MTPEQPEDVGPVPDWTNEYAAYCEQYDDEDEVNRLLDEAANAH